MYFNMRESTGLVNPDINVVFDDSIYAVDTDKEFTIDVGGRMNSAITFPSYAEQIRIIGNNYNYPITFPANILNISGLINACNNFNQPVTIPNTVTNCYNALSGIKFNSAVTLQEGITNLDGLLQMQSTGDGYTNFNQPVTIPNSVTSMINTFANCRKFNQPLNIPDNVHSVYRLLHSCGNFNSPVTLGNNVDWCSQMFSSSNFNQPITLPSTLKNAYQMFQGAANFNSEVTFNHQESLHSMFYSASNYNRPLDVPDECNSLSSTFYGAINFNSAINFSYNGNLKWMSSTFSGVVFFNQPLNIPNGVTTCDYMLNGCTEFNSVVVIPETVQNTSYMFFNVNAKLYNTQNYQYGPVDYNALRQPIYFYANNCINAQYMFSQVVSMTDLYITGIQNNTQLRYMMRNNGINRCNIYTDDVGKNYIYNTQNFTTNGIKPTWTNDTTNGCIYNTSMNIYVYNNWDGVIPE